MSTHAQRRANQRNAKHSTGPKTEQGKQTCSHNAIKHGLRAKHAVIPGEDPIEYQHKLDELRADVRPVNALEDSLVEQIADTSWRLKRISRIQAAIERHELEQAAGNEKNAGKDDQQIAGYTFSRYGYLDYLSRLARYEAQLSRRYHLAIRELTGLRKNRQQLLFRVRPMDERDREENHWQDTRRQHSPDPPSPRPMASATNGSPSRQAAAAANSAPAEQTQSGVTSIDSMTTDELDALPTDEVLRLIEKELQAASPTTSQPSPREDKN